MKKQLLLCVLLIALPFFYSCKEKVTGIVILNGPSVSMFVGQTDTLEYIVYPLSVENSATITWQSSDESVVTVKKGVITALSAGEATIYATCEKAEASCLIKVSDVKIAEKYNDAVLYFMGDRYGLGTNNFILRLLGDGLTHDDAGDISGTGFFMNICFNLSSHDNTLLAGEYKCDSLGEAYTFYPGKQPSYYYPGTYYGQLTSQGTNGFLIQKGTFKVSEEGGVFTISHSLNGSGLDISGSYTGAVAVFDYSESYTEKALTFTSATAVTLDNGETEYKSYLVTVQGDEPLQMEINVPLSATGIPIGDYEVTDAGEEFSLTKGTQSGENYNGTWLMGDAKSPVVRGSVSVSVSEGNYTIECDLYTSDTHLTGTYTGAITFE